jgi:hypothetical protein
MSYVFQVTAKDKQRNIVITTFPNKELAVTYAASVRGKVKRISNKPKRVVTVTACVPASLNMQIEAERHFNRAIEARANMNDIQRAFASYAQRKAGREAEVKEIRSERIQEEQEKIELEMALNMLSLMGEEYSAAAE